MTERCSHVQCSATATARVAFDALACFVWIDPFETDGPRDVSARGAGALCTRHADRLVPPRGWAVQDRRGREMQLWSDRPPLAAAAADPTRVAARTRTVEASSDASTAPIAFLEPALPFDADSSSIGSTVDADRAPARPSLPPDTTNSDIEDFLAAPSSPLLSRAFNAAHSRQAG